jgi:uncharacterized protein YxjI
MLAQQKTFLVKERVAFVKLTDTFDILDPATSQPAGIAKEEPSGLAKILRLVINKRLLPNRVNIYNADGSVAISIRKGALSSKIQIVAPNGEVRGFFKAKFLSGLRVLDRTGQQVADVKGDWKGWNFKITATGGAEIGTITKKWAGIGKELFTSADNYIVSVADGAGEGMALLLLAAAISIDVIYNES